MDIKGEVKSKVLSILADSIDVLRLYESAIAMLKAEKEEAARLIQEADELKEEKAKLKDRCDVLERSFGDTAALEHTVAELQERNDALRLRLDSREAQDSYRDAFAYAVSYIRSAASKGHFCSIAGLKQWLGAAHVGVEVPGPCQAQSELTDDGWPIAEKAKTEAELEKYKVALRCLDFAVQNHQYCSAQAIRICAKARMTEEGYDIETEEGRIEGFGSSGSSGSEDNSKSQDEHDFL